MNDGFPEQYGDTRGFTAGAPAPLCIVGNGRAVLFLRSATGRDDVQSLWELDVATGVEHLLVDPTDLVPDPRDPGSGKERSRRMRRREHGSGIVEVHMDRSGAAIVFALSGRLFLTDAVSRRTRELPVRTPAVDPRLSPDGTRVAYTCEGELRVVDGEVDRAVAVPDGESVEWGVIDFVAEDDLRRDQGHWWSPDGTTLLATRVDTSGVVLHNGMRFPFAGTNNAVVELFLVELDGRRTRVGWDHGSHPYLASVSWAEGHRPLATVQSRDQRDVRVLAVDTGTGTVDELLKITDVSWVEVSQDWPRWTPDGRLVWIAADDRAYRLVVDGEVLTPRTVQVASLLEVGRDEVLVSAYGTSRDDSPAHRRVLAVSATGVRDLTPGAGVHGLIRDSGVTVVTWSGLAGRRVDVLPGDGRVLVIRSHAERPLVSPEVSLTRSSGRRLPSALLLPAGYLPEPGLTLPVLLDPYGGPHLQRVLAAGDRHLVSQWFADQGMAVLVVDGRGTPGRGPAWDRETHHDLVGVLDDQIEALHAVAAKRDDLDLGRVAIRGWSFGGFLAALAVLSRPDIFHAAIAFAAVTDWRLHTTYCSERFLGPPQANPELYESHCLPSMAGRSTRPLMLIHGLGDEYIMPANSIELADALAKQGRPHELATMQDVAHMPWDPPDTAAQLLRRQRDFLLGVFARPSEVEGPDEPGLGFR